MKSKTPLLIAAACLLLACEPSSPPLGPASALTADSVDVKTKADGPSYSPFVIRVTGNKDFDTITFKDVGLIRADFTPSDPIFEILAESVSYQLTESGLETEVYYDATLLDPANHVACAGRHVYVDVWQPDTNQWGYSLWSGCGEDDNFAWQQLQSTMPDHAELPERVNDLARAVRHSISKASSTSCFQKSC